MTSLNYYNLFEILIAFLQKLQKSKERGNKNWNTSDEKN